MGIENGLKLKIGEWLPDLPPLENPGALEARNVVPEVNSYRSLDSLSTFTNTLTSPALSATWGPDSSASVYGFAGDASRLYRLTSQITWTDVSKAGNYATPTDSYWEFAQFGDRIIATNNFDAPQYFDLGTSTLFADLPGSPPKAKTIAVVRDFVMLGDLTDSSPSDIAWSGFNSSELWTPSQSTQADQQRLLGLGGKVQRIIGGDYGLIFQENSIWRATYQGPPIVFNLDEIITGHGTPAPRSVVRERNTTYYYSLDGFYRISEGGLPEPIGANRVNRWFEENADVEALSSMQGAVDRRNRLVVWAFRSSSSSAHNDRLMIYNWAADKWAYAEVDTQVLWQHASTGLTLDDLDTPFPLGIDLESINVDSDAFKRNLISLMAFDTTNAAGTFSGAALPAEVDTVENISPNGQRHTIYGVRPLLEANQGSDIKCSVLYKRNEVDRQLTQTPPRSINPATGESDVRINARRARFRINTTGRFDSLTGVEFRARLNAGRR